MSKRLCSVTVPIAPAPSFAELVSVIVDAGGTLEGEPIVMRFPDGSAYAIQAYWMPEDWDEPIELQPARPAFTHDAETLRALRSATDEELAEFFAELLADLSPDWYAGIGDKALVAAERIREFDARILAGDFEAAHEHSRAIAGIIARWKHCPRPMSAYQAPEVAGVLRTVKPDTLASVTADVLAEMRADVGPVEGLRDVNETWSTPF